MSDPYEEQVVQAAVTDIFHQKKGTTRFWQQSDKILEEKVKDLPADKRAGVKARIRQQVAELDEVLPGINREEARSILYSSLQTPRVYFAIFTWLNVALFIVGLGLLIAAAVVGLIREAEQFTIIFGAGGLAAVIPFFISNPLKRISNAASDQSQLRTVVFGFWSQLANLRKAVQSYGSNPTPANIKVINTEIQAAMKQSSELLQKYVESKVTEESADLTKNLKELQERVDKLESKSNSQPAP